MTTWLRVPRVAPPARFATVIVVLICSAELGGQQPRGPDRLQPPALGPAPTLTVPAIDKRTLSNGLPIWIVRTHKVPLAQLEFVGPVRPQAGVGALQEPEAERDADDAGGPGDGPERVFGKREEGRCNPESRSSRSRI